MPIAHPKLGKDLFAIARTLSGKTPDDIREHVLATLGKSHVLGGVLELHQLGLQEFPVNATHKIMKRELEEAVTQHLRQNRDAAVEKNPASIEVSAAGASEFVSR